MNTKTNKMIIDDISVGDILYGYVSGATIQYTYKGDCWFGRVDGSDIALLPSAISTLRFDKHTFIIDDYRKQLASLYEGIQRNQRRVRASERAVEACHEKYEYLKELYPEEFV
jgi:hypothetical protein